MERGIVYNSLPFSAEAHGTGGLSVTSLVQILEQCDLTDFDICFVQIGENDVKTAKDDPPGLNNHELMHALIDIVDEFHRQGVFFSFFFFFCLSFFGFSFFYLHHLHFFSIFFSYIFFLFSFFYIFFLSFIFILANIREISTVNRLVQESLPNGAVLLEPLKHQDKPVYYPLLWSL